MIALIDVDPLVYQYASLTNMDGEPLPAPFSYKLALGKIEKICEAVGATDWEGFLTYGPDNFRIKVATIREYKGNRKYKEKPHHYDYLRGRLSDHPNIRMVFGMEADDALAIRQYEDIGERGEEDTRTIICTIDKDLEMVPGWHYRWEKGNVKEILPWKQTRIEGLRCFYRQLLTGDSVDNIHGLRGVGPKSAYVAAISELDSEESMASYVLGLYTKWYGNYAEQFMSENGKLLWMLMNPEDEWDIQSESLTKTKNKEEQL